LKEKSFETTLERMSSRLQWVIAPIPFDVSKVWGVRGQLRVKGDVNGFAFRGCLFPTREGRHFLLVNKRLLAGGKVTAGDRAKFRLEPDTEKRILTMPTELERALAEDRRLRRWYDGLNPSTRNEIAKWVAGVQSGAARLRRAGQMAERLFETMEAEREMPPVLQVAMAGNPLAQEGWASLSSARRRGHLLGIFYYRDPAARARRAAKAVEDAVGRARQKAKV
jgi:uncharacterized protein YdeI (YjbR/CyaY-like superfamily)